MVVGNIICERNYKYEFKLIDTMGKTLSIEKKTALVGKNTITIPVDNLANGVFFIQFLGDNFSSGIKFVKND